MRIGRRAWIAGSLALTALSLTGLHANPDKVNDLYLESCAACHGEDLSGGKELAIELEAKGYDWVKTELASA